MESRARRLGLTALATAAFRQVDAAVAQRLRIPVPGGLSLTPDALVAKLLPGVAEAKSMVEASRKRLELVGRSGRASPEVLAWSIHTVAPWSVGWSTSLTSMAGSKRVGAAFSV